MHHSRTSTLFVIAAKDRHEELQRAEPSIHRLSLMSPIIVNGILDVHALSAILLKQRIRVRDRANLVEDRFIKIHLIRLGGDAVETHDPGTIDDLLCDRAFQERLAVLEEWEEVDVVFLRLELDQTLLIRGVELGFLRG